MSDPVTDLQTDDLLASIRKLVSREVGPFDTTSLQTGQGASAPDRLVLTHAQRVIPGTGTQKPEAAQPLVLTSRVDCDDPAASATDESVSNTQDGDLRKLDDALQGMVAAALARAMVSRGREQAPVGQDRPARSAPDKAATEARLALPMRSSTAPTLTLDQKIAELATLVAATGSREQRPAPDAQADATPVPDVPAATLAQPDTPETRLIEPVSTPEGATAPPEVDQAQDTPVQDDLPSEDRLRDLVAAILRRELQGTQGDGLSDDIRDLIRREIQQGLKGAQPVE
ncbi:hypothetical protein P775_17395 [Puniceibacterium antarcticum]|uniref:Uncharacterized protein n=1 Tax=Puniceibacterium antarcticum TaxID=1206336 RepID=A0A2G8RCJ1_9RHOB|nr:hypothetical protein [Puniceibacterium antarcticum]PIL18818.1 hypothetical protein P775_17395 [Puniceibacterium antarcticum]